MRTRMAMSQSRISFVNAGPQTSMLAAPLATSIYLVSLILWLISFDWTSASAEWMWEAKRFLRIISVRICCVVWFSSPYALTHNRIPFVAYTLGGFKFHCQFIDYFQTNFLFFSFWRDRIKINACMKEENTCNGIMSGSKFDMLKCVSFQFLL